MLLHKVEQETGDKLVGIGTALVDIAAGMASQPVAYIKQEVMEISRGKRAVIFEGSHGVDTAGAPYKHFGIIFRVEVNQNRPGQFPLFKIVGAGHAGFLIHGDKHLERAVNQVLIGQRGQCGSNTDTVVGAKRGAVGTHPLAIDDSCNRGVFEIEILVVALAHHIHMALQNNRRGVLMTRGGRFAHNHVTNLIGMSLNAVCFGELKDIITDFFLLFRGTGDFRNLIENLKHSLWLKVFHLHGNITS